MLKTGLGLLLFTFIFSSALAQKTDTLKADTNLLNKYRLEPARNSLPNHVRPVQVTEQLIPVELLDYKVSYWHKSVVWGLNFNQSAFTGNWSAGGISSVALGTNFDFKADYNKTPLDYTTETNLIYGIAANKGQGSRKTNDRIFLDNKLATRISKQWYFFGSLSFESQFTAGYTYTDAAGNPVTKGLTISNFMAPGYLTESIGFEYKPNKYYDIRLGTGTAKQTFVTDTTIYHNLPENYGVKPGHTFYNQLAFQGVATVDKDLMKNLHLNARYAIFIPYVQPFAYTTHRVDATLTAKVNKLINVSMNATLLYDKNTSHDPQATEGISMGVAYTFP
ncbi:DUF3078 domain-containing protein [Mucilaginibacter sp.]|jgi:hypothetical protein|uniref:DUF3078 domain-containing protein n=1 Tax=Mucilaginibacter sp. TaxID=1882438 RepID=UPI002CD569CD|nr:DUF3078 domain-containing protein [Mucilaginibacter sp.]HTI59981.1 DUF3078 domain-containing protein [Mucilaginibacter sp.]